MKLKNVNPNGENVVAKNLDQPFFFEETYSLHSRISVSACWALCIILLFKNRVSFVCFKKRKRKKECVLF
jgi:hypothetical protein